LCSIARPQGADAVDEADDPISFVRSGAIDLHCGPMINAFQHKTQVDFGMTYYVLQYRYASKEWAHMMEIGDMGGKSMATMYGSPAMRALEALDVSRGMGIRILPANTNEQAWRRGCRGDGRCSAYAIRRPHKGVGDDLVGDAQLRALQPSVCAL
jgi:hypothetical protein